MNRAALQFAVVSDVCARCDGPMQITHDALQRPRHRCPKCDGVAPVRHHPDQVLVPITMVPLSAVATASATTLPAIEPGQLRCQRCAKGVEGTARFHPECLRLRKHDQLADSRARHWTPGTCRNCGYHLPKKVGRPPKFCEACR